mmetsp:Transcript_82125/g.227781  ORF Transcript_82125/g.227781 Transcript_82125/m.227781 type:complete len:226 (+) Transcript_82125:41-718(+)
MLRVCPWLMPWVVCATLIRLSARASCYSPDRTDECMARSIGLSMLQMRRNLLMVQPEGSKSSQNRTFLDAIIVLGGGLTDAGLPTPWVEARLARAKAIYDSVAGPSHSGKPHLICSGKGTANEAGAGDDITEAEACARFLVERSVPPHDILQEPLSRDTVGNAFFSRIVHTDFLGAKKSGCCHEQVPYAANQGHLQSYLFSAVRLASPGHLCFVLRRDPQRGCQQ